MGVRVRVGFLLFYYELAPLIRDVICSKLYFDGKKHEEATSDEHPQFMIKRNHFTATHCIVS